MTIISYPTHLKCSHELRSISRHQAVWTRLLKQSQVKLAVFFAARLDRWGTGQLVIRIYSYVVSVSRILFPVVYAIKNFLQVTVHAVEACFPSEIRVSSARAMQTGFLSFRPYGEVRGVFFIGI